MRATARKDSSLPIIPFSSSFAATKLAGTPFETTISMSPSAGEKNSIHKSADTNRAITDTIERSLSAFIF